MKNIIFATVLLAFAFSCNKKLVQLSDEDIVVVDTIRSTNLVSYSENIKNQSLTFFSTLEDFSLNKTNRRYLHGGLLLPLVGNFDYYCCVSEKHSNYGKTYYTYKNSVKGYLVVSVPSHIYIENYSTLDNQIENIGGNQGRVNALAPLCECK